MIDNINMKILAALSDDSRISAKKIATMLGLDEKDVADRIELMEKDGVIVKYSTVINTDKLNLQNVQALIEVKVSPQRNEGFDAIAEQLMAYEEVKSVYLMSGTYDLMLIIEGSSLKEVALFVSDKLSTADNILSTATHFILKRYKENGVVINGKNNEHRLVVSP
ncbi:MAG TPA: Lrp/AsnC family transcriptional regulator [Clostridia bacterium]|nr:Lrp/AsnC family transcriptional regulator [Clostridia bacterium]